MINHFLITQQMSIIKRLLHVFWHFKDEIINKRIIDTVDQWTGFVFNVEIRNIFVFFVIYFGLSVSDGRPSGLWRPSGLQAFRRLGQSERPSALLRGTRAGGNPEGGFRCAGVRSRRAKGPPLFRPWPGPPFPSDPSEDSPPPGPPPRGDLQEPEAHRLSAGSMLS